MNNLDNNHLYVLDEFGIKAVKLNNSSPKEGELIGVFQLDGDKKKITTGKLDSLLYISDGVKGIKIVDASNPNTLV